MSDQLFGRPVTAASPQTATDATPVEPAPDIDLEACRTWLEQRSLHRSKLDDKLLSELRAVMGGNEESSRRTYWSCVQSLLHWAVQSGRLATDPSAGLPTIRRDVEAEKVDPDRTPGEVEVLLIAEAMKQKVGQWDFVFIIVLAFCAQRIGEGVDLRRSSTPQKATTDDLDAAGMWLVIGSQGGRQVARHSDDGVTTKRAGSPTKGRRSRRTPGRPVYLSSR